MDQQVVLKIKKDLRDAVDMKLPALDLIERYKISEKDLQNISDIIRIPGGYVSLAYPESRIDYLS